MTQIRCPNCGMIDQVELEGSYLVTCGRCDQKFTAVIVRARPLPQVEVVCPQCASTQQLRLSLQNQPKGGVRPVWSPVYLSLQQLDLCGSSSPTGKPAKKPLDASSGSTPYF